MTLAPVFIYVTATRAVVLVVATLEETGKIGKLIVLIYTSLALDLPHSGWEGLKQKGEGRGARKPQTTNVQPVIFQSRKSLLE